MHIFLHTICISCIHTISTHILNYSLHIHVLQSFINSYTVKSGTNTSMVKSNFKHILEFKHILTQTHMQIFFPLLSIELSDGALSLSLSPFHDNTSMSDEDAKERLAFSFYPFCEYYIASRISFFLLSQLNVYFVFEHPFCSKFLRAKCVCVCVCARDVYVYVCARTTFMVSC